jgi:plasmid stabilization system protein ParE
VPELEWHPNVAALLARLSDEQRDRLRQRIRALSRFPLLGQSQPVSSIGLRRLTALGWKVIYRYDQASDVVTIVVLLPPRSSISMSD